MDSLEQHERGLYLLLTEEYEPIPYEDLFRSSTLPDDEEGFDYRYLAYE